MTPKLIERLYNRLFSARDAREEWQAWHNRTAGALATVRSGGARPKELTDPSEQKYYASLTKDVAGLLSRYGGAVRRMVEVGCGSGALSYHLSRQLHADATLVDNEAVALSYAEELFKGSDTAVTCVQADAIRLPLADASFDFAHSEGLIEHFDDGTIHRMLAETRRVLRESGLLFLAVPNYFCPDMISTWRRYGKGTERHMTKGELGSLVRAAGFTPVHAGHTSYVFDAHIAATQSALEACAGRAGLGFLKYVLARAGDTRRDEDPPSPVR